MAGWRSIMLPSDQASARVTGIDCTSTDSCVFSTAPFGSAGQLLAGDDTSVTGVLFDTTDYTDAFGILGSVQFEGLDRTRNGLVARVSTSGGYVSAASDFTNAASWSGVALGTDGDGFGINAQLAIQAGADGTWVFANDQGAVFRSTMAPSPTTLWTATWSPNAIPTIPADFRERYAADPTLCEADIGVGISPNLTHGVFVSQDLGLIAYPARGLNQRGSAVPGACISTDGGITFYDAPFPGLPEEDYAGPLGITCIDNDRCWAFNGQSFSPDTAWVYYTTNASDGATSTWTRATVPAGWAGASGVAPRVIFFAPDGVHGWIAGQNGDNRAMLARTTDGGRTWTDVSTSIRTVTEAKLYSGFALDADHLWIGGDNGALVYSDNGGQ